jgi:glycosyltransferase involved in cell wall biosynthesis
MRILALTTSWPRHADDHCGRFVYDLHEALRLDFGHEVTTIAPASEGAPAVEDSSAGLAVRVGRDEGVFQRRGLEHELLRRPWRWRAVVRYMEAAKEALAARAPQAELLLVHWPLPLLRAVPDSWPTPILGVAHGADLGLARRPRIAAMLSRGRVRGRLAGLLSVRRIAERDLRESFGSVPHAVHPMGANPRVFRCEGAVDPLARGRLLGVGRLERQKGFDLLVRAAAEFKQAVMLLGDGPERPRLLRLARALHVDLHAPGFQSCEAVASALRGARLLVQPSRMGFFGREEGFPVAVMEARALGCPVLAARTGGLAERLRAEELFACGDFDDLVRQLGLRLQDSALAARSAQAEASMTATAQALLALVPQR